MATMNSNEGSKTWRPGRGVRAMHDTDLLRGFALFGVLRIDFGFQCLPPEAILRAHAANAIRIYGQGSFLRQPMESVVAFSSIAPIKAACP
jgi:hypothetical protein